MKAKRVILGVDPGLQFTGYAIIIRHERGSAVADYGFLPLNKEKDLVKRVALFYSFFLEKIRKHGVTHISLETPFLGKNAQAFLKLGYLRGILYLLAEQHACKLSEFSPRQVKLSVTGYGGASKEQVALMMMRMVPGLADVGKTMRNDVTDALAVGICGLHSD